MNQRILSTLEFNQVKQMIMQYVVTAQGANEVELLAPVTDQQVIQAWLDETADGLKVQRLRGGIPIPKLENIRPHMKRIEIGADLNGIELAQISRVLSTTAELSRFFLI
jgi:DNA mismatch repair protein MutS2